MRATRATSPPGIRYAARRKAKIINLSLEFDTEVTAVDIPQILDAIAYARARGSLVIAASGNEGRARVAYPARATGVLSVGATTEHGCLAEFSNGGSGLDLVAPGGGADAALSGDPNCRPGDSPGRNVFQVTLLGRAIDNFGIPGSYEGTSMAVPHVAATAALIVASRRPRREPVAGAHRASPGDDGPRHRHARATTPATAGVWSTPARQPRRPPPAVASHP